jgi:uncharacterized membrane protein YheB (UPF0754 family)
MKVELSEDEKKLIKSLLNQEVKKFEEQEKEQIRPEVPFLAVEEKYDEFVKKLLRKFE